jgi:hypothetical protein
MGNPLLVKIQADGKILPRVLENGRRPDLLIIAVQHLVHVTWQMRLPDDGTRFEVELVGVVSGLMGGRRVSHDNAQITNIQMMIFWAEKKKGKIRENNEKSQRQKGSERERDNDNRGENTEQYKNMRN